MFLTFYSPLKLSRYSVQLDVREWMILLNNVTFNLNIWHYGLSSHCLGQV